MNKQKQPLTQKEFSSRGGKARAKKLSKKRRSEIARMGGLARIKKFKKHGQILQS